MDIEIHKELEQAIVEIPAEESELLEAEAIQANPNATGVWRAVSEEQRPDFYCHCFCLG
jgi:hypothetical protein